MFARSGGAFRFAPLCSNIFETEFGLSIHWADVVVMYIIQLSRTRNAFNLVHSVHVNPVSVFWCTYYIWATMLLYKSIRTHFEKHVHARTHALTFIMIIAVDGLNWFGGLVVCWLLVTAIVG